MSLGKIQLSVLALILANIIWGAAFPIYKWSLEVIPPFTFAFLRFYVGALIILPFVLKILEIRCEDYLKVFLLSICSVTILIPLLFLGLQLTPSINAPIIIASGPIFLIAASVIFLKEKLKTKVFIGTLISLLGVAVIILRPLIEAGFSGGILGNFFIFGATVCSVFQAILLKKLMANYHPLTIIFWMFLIGSLPLLPFVIWENMSFNLWENMNIQAATGLIYGIILATVIAHFFLAFGIKYIKASEVGIFTYVDPLATIIVAVPLLNETITPAYLVGALFVFMGIFIAEGRIHYHPFQKLRA